MSSKTPNRGNPDNAPENRPDQTAAAIVEAALMHVPFDGWGSEALLAGASDAGFGPEAVDAHFPGGAIDAIVLHSALADEAMVAAFDAMDDRPEKIHLIIRTLILVRLEQASAHKEAVRRALSVLALPGNALISAKSLYRTIDLMWRSAGQRDTDFSFYTKRASLAGVYSATLLAWVADNSGDMEATEAFLDRRLGDIARIPKATAPFKAFASLGAGLGAGIGQKLAKGATMAMKSRFSQR